VLPLMIELNVPTAYIVPPHWTSWRTCWVVLGALWGFGYWWVRQV
jgi:hypothetical protein